MDYDITKQIPFAINTPEDARRALELMEKILTSLNDETHQQRLSYSFYFRVGNINCSGGDRDEFISEIFGQTDFWLGSIRISARPPGGDSTASLLLTRSEPWDLVMYSNSKGVLLELECSYNIAVNEIINPLKESVAIGTYIDQSQHVSIGGDANNAVIGNNNTVTGGTPSTGKKKSFWTPILQSVMANLIWWLLGTIIVLTLGMFVAIIKAK